MTNTIGAMTALLDACLIDGFNLKPIDTLTFADGVATARINAGHLYQVDQVVVIAGANQSEYNGEVRVLTTTANNFTFAVSGMPVTPATGTISAKVAPLNFDKPFSATNKRVYRSKSILSNRAYLRVDDALDPAWTGTYAKKAKVLMAEGMSDVDTVVGAQAPFDPARPLQNTAGSGSGGNAYDGWYKWYYARRTDGNADNVPPEEFNRDWVLVGDDRGFYLFNEVGASYRSRSGYCFTDFESFRQGDAYNTLLMATDAYTPASTYPGGYYPDANNYCNRSLNHTGKVLMRDHLQVGGNARAGFLGLNTNNAEQISGYRTGVPWPNGPDYGLILHPTYLRQESGGHLRGKMPGIFWVHNEQPLVDLAVVSNVTGYAGRKFLMVNSAVDYFGNVARFAFDITGPWR
ncbi:hypothetical protein [Rhodoferax sp.]|uniref:hypothetical protein n=1 Tax=Rhodoferax sp. TaxID=50421 RepID=UPI0025E1EC75|nr:hypothetical protein [Rhodoferax sp.]